MDYNTPVPALTNCKKPLTGNHQLATPHKDYVIVVSILNNLFASPVYCVYQVDNLLNL